ncbi:MAG: TetR/AcrR family transcriptional regulator [Bacteroides sp.]|nr:TetR/AcrR family transcriptional regulator [Bacteroides sp.]
MDSKEVDFIQGSTEQSSRDLLKQTIIIKAAEAFAKEGIRSVKMDDIAASLGISKRTLYEIFKDKEELLTECMFYRKGLFRKSMEGVYIHSKNVLEVFMVAYEKSMQMYHSTNKLFFEDMKKYPKIHQMIHQSRADDYKHSVELLQKGVEQGYFRNDVNFEIINHLLYAQLDALMDMSNKFSFTEICDSIIFTFIRGISTELGARELDKFIEEYRLKKNR